MHKIISIIVLFQFLFIRSFGQLTFDHLSVTNGLSQSTVLSICKDSRGYMWFGTRDRLNRYDGRTFKVYKNDPGNPASISSDDYIYVIAEDKTKQNLWIGTQKGLNYYSPKTDSFEQIYHNASDKYSLSGPAVLSVYVAKDGKIWFGTNGGLSVLENSKSRKFKNFYVKDGLAGVDVYAVYEDSKGNIWVGTTQGLTLMTPAVNEHGYNFTNFRYSADSPESISGNSVKTIAEDHKGRIWIGTEKDGMNLYLPATKSFKRFRYNALNSNGLSNDFIRKIINARDGKLWIATMSGLNIYDPETDHFEVYKNDSENRKSLSDNSVKDIYEDEQGSVWIGTNFGGINVAHKSAVPFNVLKHSKYRNSISNDIISVIAADGKNNLLIGTEGYGLNYYDIKNQVFTHYKHNPLNSESVGSNTIKAIFKDRNNRIWIGLYEGGLEFFDPNTGKFKHYRPNPNNPKSLSYGYVSCIAQDKQGRLWIGTSSRGLNLFHPEAETFTRITSTSEGLRVNSDYIRTILGDSKGNLWVGTATGLSFLPKNGNQFELFYKETHGLKSNYINCIKEDSRGNIWIGSHRGGLSLYVPEKKNFINYSAADGLASDNIVGIEEDNDGNIWVSTDNGLSKFNVKQKNFKNYYVSDGLATNEFSYNAAFKAYDGTLYFGSYDGLVAFKPQNIAINEIAPKVVFSGLRLFNKTVEVNGNDKLLENDISYTDKIVFKASQNIFTIDFVALNYIKSERNKYAYKLEGFEKDWNYVNIPSATYTNLPAGTYNLLVKGSNNDGIWNEKPASLKIQILPPLWKTWWAYTLYVIIAVLILYYVNRFLRRQERLETELYYEHINSERQKELYQTKLDFFTRISHEIRTPLTLIFAPLEKVLQLTKNSPALNSQLQNIKNNTDRLLRLISELLDFRKIETGNLKLKVSETDIIAFCNNIFKAYKSQAVNQHIDFRFEHREESLLVFFDAGQMEKVLFNLLSNAFKYTPDNGKIILKVYTQHDKVNIAVEDNGIGIPYEHQDKIFTNFYQIKDNKNQPIGWGIGLAMVKSIVDLHKGDITLRSEPSGEGKNGHTEFIVSLLMGTAHFSTEDLVHGNESETVKEHDLDIINTENIPDAVESPKQNIPEKKYTILVVEDNTELREFIISSLENDYHVTGKSNGQEGLDYALENIPDIIISDVTMPIMDGFEFCNKLKNEEKTNHIPVIMLTAMASHMHQIDGLEAGADIYITKPFSIQVLELSIRNLLTSRESLKAKYSKQVMLMPRNVEIESPEEKFLDKLMQIIEDKLDDPDFNVTSLVSEIGMSQTVLYKKIKALTDLSITDFIKSIRLKRAAQLLRESKMNISEIAYAVGFNDRKYFSKEFKKQFGKAPSDYVD